MTKAKRLLLEEVAQYLKASLDGEHDSGDTTSFLSALVNVLDTVMEGQANQLTYKGGLSQSDREVLILEAILAHNNN